MSINYRAVVIGCGKIGALWGLDPARTQPASWAGALQAHAKVDVVGLVDRDSQTLAKATEAYGVEGYSDARDAVEKLKPDVVIIATPPDSHEELLALMLELTVPFIVCEKPLTTTVESAERMVKAAVGHKVLVNHQRRFFPLYKAAQKRIADGELGEIVKATGHYSKGLLNNGSHLIDIVFYMVPQKKMPLEFVVHDDSEEIHDLILEGTKGTLKITHLGYRFEWPGGAEEDVRSMLEPSVSHIVECLDGTAMPLCTPEDGLKVIRALSVYQ